MESCVEGGSRIKESLNILKAEAQEAAEWLGEELSKVFQVVEEGIGR